MNHTIRISFFLNDVYDWNYFVQIYVKHVYTKKILKICEISFNPTKESLLRQLSAEKINLDKFSFYNLYNNNKIKILLPNYDKYVIT